MALVPYVAYVNRTNGPRSPYYDTNLPGLDGARDLNHLRTKVPETFRELYRRYNHNVRSWEIKSGVLPANRAAIVSVPVNIPLGDLFLPAGLWIFSSAEAIAFAQRVWVVWGQGGRGVWSVAVSYLSFFDLNVPRLIRRF